MASDSFHGIIGQSSCMQQLFALIEKLAEDDLSTVLIQGESGTGKELVAKAIHNHSIRAKKHFVPVNCAAIPDDLLESELFGHTKGAFTGASSAKAGRIEYADGGSLFLDEIGDMKPALQAKLLRVIQEREFEPVGALKARPVDVRIIAATHRDLEHMVSEGKFREDLYYRLSVVPVEIPPLRERRQDIPLLIQYFSHLLSQTRKKSLKGFTEEALRALSSCHWRGNVRELENLVQHMTILYSETWVDLEQLPEKYHPEHVLSPEEFAALNEEAGTRTEAQASTQGSQDQAAEQNEYNEMSLAHLAKNIDPAEDETLDFNALANEFERQLIIQALQKTEGNKKEAARLLNLKRTTLLEKIKKKNLQNNWSQ